MAPDVVFVGDDGSIIQGNDMDTCAAARAYYSRFRDNQHFLFVFGQDGTDLAGGRERTIRAIVIASKASGVQFTTTPLSVAQRVRCWGSRI